LLSSKSIVPDSNRSTEVERPRLMTISRMYCEMVVNTAEASFGA
jgi:hypothetical protein